MTHFRKTKPSLTNLSRRRRRTLSEAIEITARAGLQGKALQEAENAIFKAAQPKAEARRRVQFHHQQKLKRAISFESNLDLSDVQELKVRLIRKYGVLYESDAQMLALKRMELDIASGTMTKNQFQTRSIAVLKMEIGTVDHKQRMVEAKRLRSELTG